MKIPKIFRFFNRKDISFHLLATVISFFVLLGAGISAVVVLVLIRMLMNEWFVALAPTTLIMMALVISTVIGTGIWLFTSKRFLRPIDHMINSQKKVARGDFSAKVPLPKGDTIITDLAKGFNAMTDELAGTEILRNDFINNFSHEFKTPIVSIKGFAKQLQNDELPEEQKKEYIDIIVKESDRLASMSSNILLLTKFENQQMVTNKTYFYLDEQIRNCILLLEKEWSKKQLNLDIDLKEIKYYSNEEMLSHVWLNILGNAVKFTQNEGTISVKCDMATDGITVRISDNGIGMDEQTQNRIFDKFYQGDSSHTELGNGLGLSLAKRVVTLCGGTITVKSKAGKGTTFTVHLPVDNV